MKSVFASDLAIASLAALTQRPGGMALAEISRSIGSSISATQAAVGHLVEAGIVVPDSDVRPRYDVHPDATEPARHLVAAALGLGSSRALEAALRANRAVELAVREGDGLLVITTFDAAAADEARLESLVAMTELRTVIRRHDDVRRDRGLALALRERAGRGRIITGSMDRSLPDPDARGSLDAPFLARLHPDVDLPSASAMARIAREFGLEQVRAFGSAVHGDFRPDSDVDLLVRRRRGTRRTLEGEMRLRRAFEDVFGRDVDVVDASIALPQIAARADLEGVDLYG